MQVVLPQASCSRAFGGRLTYLRGLHNWFLSLRWSWFFCSRNWHIMVKINTLLKSLEGYFNEISHYFSTSISTKESIKLPPKHLGEICKEVNVFCGWLLLISFFILTPIGFKMKLVFERKVLLNSTDNSLFFADFCLLGTREGSLDIHTVLVTVLYLMARDFYY